MLRRFTRGDCECAKKQGSTKEVQRCRVEQSRAAPGAECRAGSDELQKSGAEVLVVQR